MKCMLGGGKTGNYDVVVIEVGIGGSIPSAGSKFSYKIVVKALSRVSGSLGGGYPLVISG